MPYADPAKSGTWTPEFDPKTPVLHITGTSWGDVFNKVQTISSGPGLPEGCFWAPAGAKEPVDGGRFSKGTKVKFRLNGETEGDEPRDGVIDGDDVYTAHDGDWWYHVREDDGREWVIPQPQVWRA